MIKDYYERWREALPEIGITLDPKRLFDASDQATIRTREGELCAICKEQVLIDDAEYDHFPVPYRDGGCTVPQNGRLLHRECHPRGRPLED